jgi:hypothetical protein
MWRIHTIHVWYRFFPYTPYVVESDAMGTFLKLCIQQSTMISRAEPKIIEFSFILCYN